MNLRIRKLRKALDLTQAEFAEKIGSTANVLTHYETGRRNPSSSVINNICKTFNVSETWLRTGEGEMFTPSPDGALEALAREYELSPGMYILIKRLLALKPENQQAAVDFAVKLAEDLNRLYAPVVISKTETPTPAPHAGTNIPVPAAAPDLAAKVAELEQQNQEKDRRREELAAEIAAMKEEDALLGLTDAFSASPSVSAGSIRPTEKAKL